MSRTARFLAVVLGVLSPSVAFGAGLIHATCMLRDGAATEVGAPDHHHGPDTPAAGDHPGCTWLGPCSGPLAAHDPAPGGPEFRGEIALRPAFYRADHEPKASPLAFLIPQANPPPFSN